MFCWHAERALDSLTKTFGDSLVFFSYHAFEYDTFYNTESHTRDSLYSIIYEPTCVFAGTEFVTPITVTDPDSFYSVYKQYVLGVRSRTTSLTMEFDTALTKIEANQLKIGLTVNPTESLPDLANLRLFLVIFEDSLFYQSEYYLKVVRKLLPNTQGLNLTVNFPNSFDTLLTIQLENWNTTQLGVAAFVQNMQTKEVLQAVVKRNLRR